MSIERLIEITGDVPNKVWAESMRAYLKAYEDHKAQLGSAKLLPDTLYDKIMRDRGRYQLQAAFEVTREYWSTQPEVKEHLSDER